LKDCEVDVFCSRLLHDVVGRIPGAIAGCILHHNQLAAVYDDQYHTLHSTVVACYLYTEKWA